MSDSALAEAVVAVDVGGTTIKGAVALRDGTEVARLDRPTPVGVELVVSAIAETISQLVAEVEASVSVGAVGLVVPGIVDGSAGIARYSANIGWRDLPLRQVISNRVGLPVALDHDVRAAGLVEAERGAARGIDDALFIAIGTGIAGAVIANGTVVAGPTGLAGEIGHLPVVPHGEECVCGQRGCTEAYASAAALARRYARAAGDGAANLDLRAEDVVHRALVGDRIAARVFDEAVTVLARALVGYTLLMDPFVIVVGGGLAGAGDALLEPLADELQHGLAWRPAPPMVRAHFGADAGRIGAALLGWSCRQAQYR